MKTGIFVCMCFVLNCTSHTEDNVHSKHSINFCRMNTFYPNFTELVTDTWQYCPACLMPVSLQQKIWGSNPVLSGTGHRLLTSIHIDTLKKTTEIVLFLLHLPLKLLL